MNGSKNIVHNRSLRSGRKGENYDGDSTENGCCSSHIDDDANADAGKSSASSTPAITKSRLLRGSLPQLIEALLLLAFNVLPPLIMGLPGLFLRHRIRSLSSSSSSRVVELLMFALCDLLPQWLENAVLLAIGHSLCRTVMANLSRLWRDYSHRSLFATPTSSASVKQQANIAGSDHGVDTAAMLVELFGSVTLLLFVVSCSVLFSMADYVAQDQMGASPSLSLVVDTISAGPKQVLVQQARSQPHFVSLAVASVVAPYALGIATYAAGLRWFAPSSMGLACSDKAVNQASQPFARSPGLFLFRRGPRSCAAAITMLLVVYSVGGYAPVTNVFLCTFIGSPLKMARAQHLAKQTPPIVLRHRMMARRRGALPVDSHGGSEGRRKRPLPNVVLIVVDSLSGHLMEMREGRKSMPYYHRNMSQAFGERNTFKFSFARTTSGSTKTALMGFLTGLIPFTAEGKTLVKQALSPAGEFKKLGYETAIFNSLKSIPDGHGLDHFKNCLEDGWDAVYTPETLGEPLVNLDTMDDRILVERFQEWLRQRSERKGSKDEVKPFFVLHYWSNIHSPWTAVSDFLDLHHTVKYFKLMTVIDDQIRRVYESISDANLINSTFVIGGADHGDRPGHWRQTDPDSPFVLNVPLWMHVPPAVLPDDGERALLRTQAESRAVSNLDVMPTLRHMVGMGDFTEDELANCIPGLNLLAPAAEPEEAHGNASEAQRVQMAWAGPPLEDGCSVVMLIRKDRALSLHTKGGKLNKEIGFHVDRELGHKARKIESRLLEELSLEERQSWVKDVERILLSSKSHKRFIEEKLPKFREAIVNGHK